MDERPGLQDRFGLVRCGYIRALEEESDGDLVAPEQRFFNGSLKVGGIVGRIVFEFFDPRPEPLESVVVVVGHAWAEDIDKGKTLVLDRSLEQLVEVFLFGADATRDEGCTSGAGWGA